ncbi:MAG TPA: hypothetical protein P5186_26310 [Candidatus Paceibacterota bacterium]|nr:hypothetical protein [Verrucomicrobiota bacterium]HRY51567.1 hypothetical protein [Candidatus Paceibacterota bacterium]
MPTSDSGDELRKKVSHIITWRSGTKRAPHKPLQLLLAIASTESGGPRLLSYATIEEKLRKALQVFGPVRKSDHPEYPFWHLQTDRIWEVKADCAVTLRRGSLNPTAKELRQKGASGGFLVNYDRALRDSLKLRMDLIHDILDTHFPPSIHEDILTFFGLSFRQEHDIQCSDCVHFRQRVLTAYDSACAITNYSVRMENSVLGVEPAHVLWPQAGGKDQVTNAIAMTTLHRKLFHLGVFTVDANCRIRVSKNARGSSGFEEMVGRFDGRKISLPADPAQQPSLEALAWHREQVFRP